MKKEKTIIKIKIQSLEDVLNETGDVMWAIKQGKKVAPQRSLVFPNMDVLRSILTPERMRVLQTVKVKRPHSVAELAKLLGRKYANVFLDVQKLTELGLIEKNGAKHPGLLVADYEAIQIEIPITA